GGSGQRSVRLPGIYCFLVAVMGLFGRFRDSTLYRVLSFVGLMCIPALHVLGTVFLNLNPV
ncbi:hypothetical protein QNM99_23880, partial [Pseudomonas sp. PCH446]